MIMTQRRLITRPPLFDLSVIWMSNPIFPRNTARKLSGLGLIAAFAVSLPFNCLLVFLVHHLARFGKNWCAKYLDEFINFCSTLQLSFTFLYLSLSIASTQMDILQIYFPWSGKGKCSPILPLLFSVNTGCRGWPFSNRYVSITIITLDSNRQLEF